MGLLFEKPSTRTSTSFEVAAIRLGGKPLYFSASELQLKRGEPVKDTARVLGSYLDMIVARVFSNDTVEQFAKESGVPVINALSDLEHPTQMISDMLTVYEAKGRLKGINITYVGDGNNVANSLLLACATAGANITIACPKGYAPGPVFVSKARKLAGKTGSKISVVHDPQGAAFGADVLYTDVWVSMGEEDETEKRMAAFEGYQVNSKLMRMAKKDAIVMHCLPAHRGLEITNEALEGKQSVVWQQGENKLYGAAAALEFVLSGRRQQ